MRGFVAVLVSPRTAPFKPGATIYLGVQDIRAALRYFSNHPEPYAIDPDTFFLAGIGDGGVIINHAALWGTPATIPHYKALDKEYGALDGIGEPGVFASPKGVLSLGGGITKLDLIDSRSPPMLFFHDPQDQIAPVLKGYLGEDMIRRQFSKNIRITSENGQTIGCYKPFLFSRKTICHTLMRQPYLFGPLSMTKTLSAHQIRHEVNILEGYGHEMLTSRNGIPTEAAELVFRKSAAFFFSLMRDTASIQGEKVVSKSYKRTYRAMNPAKQYQWTVQGGKVLHNNGNTIEIRWHPNAREHSLSLITRDHLGVHSYPAYLEVDVLPRKKWYDGWWILGVFPLSLALGAIYMRKR